MQRREFLKLSTSSAVFGTATVGGRFAAAAEAELRTPSAGAPPVLGAYSAADHRHRLENIRYFESSVRRCLRKELIANYLPGQACYNLGEYPSTTPWAVGEYDEQELDRLREHGIRLIQVFDDWNDALRLFGGDKYSAVNPSGYRSFIEMAHRRGMQVLTYVSTGFLERAHPDFQSSWSRPGDYLVVGYWDMARCAPASPQWRAFLLPRLVRVMDEYGADGLYVDGGYLANRHAAKQQMPLAADEIAAFRETPDCDGAFGDLLALLYAEVKRRSGILKLHVNAAEQPLTDGLRVYDYLWVGEGVAEADLLRETVKNYPPYVVPCLDLSFTSIDSENDPYLHAIPYLQFPVLMGGRVFTGQRGTVPGVTYHDDFWTRRCREAWALYQQEPSRLHTYSSWDAVPGSPNTRAAHRRWLQRYLPLVADGSWAWLEIHDSDLFLAPLPEGVVASAFANTGAYLVLANYTRQPVTVSTRDAFVSVDRPELPATAQWALAGRTLEVLRRTQ